MKGFILVILAATVVSSAIAIELMEQDRKDIFLTEIQGGTLQVDLEEKKETPKLLSEEVMNANPRLSFLGTYSGKDFYIERTLVSQTVARSQCAALNMELYMPRSQTEINWLATKTLSSDNYAWTDGRNFRNLAGFVYDQQCAPYCTTLPDSFIAASFPKNLGLTVSRFTSPSDSKLEADHTTSTHYYICTTK